MAVIHKHAGATEAPVVRQLRTDSHVYTVRGSVTFAEPVSASRPPGNRWGLTKKELRVAQLLAQFKTNEEIARELFISPHTARHHTQSVLGKMGIQSRREVAGKLSH